MYAQATGLWHGVDQAAKGRAATQREVVALGEIGGGHVARVQSLRGCGQRRRVQPGGVDDGARAQHRRLAAFCIHYHIDSCWRCFRLRYKPIHFGIDGQHAARVFHVAQQAEHEAVAVHNAGRRRQQRRVAGQRGLQRAGFVGAEQPQVVHAVGGGALLNGAQFIDLRGAGGHDQLAAALVRHAAFGAVGVQLLLALHAQPRLERAGRVVDAGVNHLAVARAGAGAKGVGGLQQHDLAAGQRQRACHRQPNHACADHDCVHGLHIRFVCLAHAASNPSSTWQALCPNSALA